MQRIKIRGGGAESSEVTGGGLPACACWLASEILLLPSRSAHSWLSVDGSYRLQLQARPARRGCGSQYPRTNTVVRLQIHACIDQKTPAVAAVKFERRRSDCGDLTARRLQTRLQPYICRWTGRLLTRAVGPAWQVERDRTLSRSRRTTTLLWAQRWADDDKGRPRRGPTTVGEGWTWAR